MQILVVRALDMDGFRQKDNPGKDWVLGLGKEENDIAYLVQPNED
ncbi:MAG: hypothetical protein ACKVT2_06355 [Saprospiraceae bacterium]